MQMDVLFLVPFEVTPQINKLLFWFLHWIQEHGGELLHLNSMLRLHCQQISTILRQTAFKVG